MKPIPITAAKEIAKKYGYDQVVIYARTPGDEGHEHVTTYGTNRMQCEAAGRIGSCIVASVVKPLEERDAKIKDLEAEVARLIALLNTPQTLDFLEAVKVEIAHQRSRWGDSHDADKRPGDWALLFNYLLGKQATAAYARDWEKYLHHIITLAAVCANAHRVMVPVIALKKMLNVDPATKKG